MSDFKNRNSGTRLCAPVHSDGQGTSVYLYTVYKISYYISYTYRHLSAICRCIAADLIMLMQFSRGNGESYSCFAFLKWKYIKNVLRLSICWRTWAQWDVCVEEGVILCETTKVNILTLVPWRSPDATCTTAHLPLFLLLFPFCVHSVYSAHWFWCYLHRFSATKTWQSLWPCVSVNHQVSHSTCTVRW